MSKFSITQIVSFLAMIVSISALIVSIRETNIMREQSQLMHTQQKTNVWPYVTGRQSFSLGEKGSVKFKMINKGIGPAIVKKTNFSIGEQPVDTYLDIFNEVKKILPDGVEFGLSTGTFGEQILRSNEELEAITITFDRFEDDYNIMTKIVINFDICYCSIYDDCWAINDYKDLITCTIAD